MMSAGGVPFLISRYTSIWFSRVLSTPAWQAATPTPGTITAWTSIRSRAPFGFRSGKPCCLTQVAEAIITCPVFASIAITDQVAKADVWAPSTKASARTTCFIPTSRRRASDDGKSTLHVRAAFAEVGLHRSRQIVVWLIGIRRLVSRTDDCRFLCFAPAFAAGLVTCYLVDTARRIRADFFLEWVTVFLQ